ncbi:transcriptional regulator, Cro/CI family [Azospirillum argentinense]|uniref:helix-turn-helix domain-containing protein n=1 Tax=Azospirillum argentinense TaxID=2970906 RepID=UPI003D7F8759
MNVSPNAATLSTIPASPTPRGRKKHGGMREQYQHLDIKIGARVRTRRTLMGLSQSDLGEAIGLTFQQVQKYERGANRIGASTLFRIAEVLDVPVSFFFDDLGAQPGQGNDLTLCRADLEFAKRLALLPKSVKDSIADLVRVLAKAEG